MTTTTNTNKVEREESALRQVRNAIIGYYAKEAWDVFTKYVDINDVELAEFRRITSNASVVFTQPSEETLKADAKQENPRFTKGRKFGNEQWYKKTQAVENALSILTSYSSFVRYMDSKENAEKRQAKRIENAAADVKNMDKRKQAEVMAKMFNVSVEDALAMLSKK